MPRVHGRAGVVDHLPHWSDTAAGPVNTPIAIIAIIAIIAAINDSLQRVDLALLEKVNLEISNDRTGSIADYRYRSI